MSPCMPGWPAQVHARLDCSPVEGLVFKQESREDMPDSRQSKLIQLKVVHPLRSASCQQLVW